MNEIACRPLQVFFRELRKKRLPPEILVQGTGCELSRFLDRNERIDWSVFHRFMENAGAVWNDDELVELGGAFLRSPYLRPIIVVARLLYTAKDFYLWVLDDRKGVGKQLMTCIDAPYREVGNNRIIIDCHTSEKYEPSRAHLLVTKGIMMYTPLMVGAPAAHVEMEWTRRGAIYDIRVPEGGGALRWLRRSVTYPFTVRAAARELKEAHELLTTRYHELARTRDELKRQTMQLRTTYRINQVVRFDLDLDHRVSAITAALVDVARFAAVELHFAAELDDVRIEQESSSGTADGEAPLIMAIENQGRSLGELRLWPEATADLAERRELLEFVMPIVALALDEALSYSVLSHYRGNLDRMVAQRTAELVEAQTLAATMEAEKHEKELQQQFSRKLLSSQERERSRIAGDLHDSVGQEVLVVKNLLALAMQDKDISENARERIEMATEAAAALLEDVRRISRDLRPIHLDELGLSATLSELLAKTAELVPFTLSYHVAIADGLLQREKEINIYRIVQEALNNIQKHAEASHASITLTYNDGAIVLSISDDGKGFSVNEQRAGLGIKGMTERTSILGGSIHIFSHPGEGTGIKITVPVEEQVAHA